ncbi:MAG: Yip1 family protein [bacterium]
MEKIIERVKSILLSPKDALSAVKTEEMTIAGVMKEYVVFVAAIPAIAQFIGYALVGLPLVGRYNIFRSLIYAAISFVLYLVAVFVVGKVINSLAPTFNAVKNDLNAFKLAVYCWTPAFVAGIFYLIPSLSILAILGALYGFYILSIGIPILMEAPQDKTIAYTLVTIVVTIIIMFVIGAIAGALAWGGGAGPARYF